MAVLQDDIASAIVTVMKTSDFDSSIPGDQVSKAYGWLNHGPDGRALVSPLSADPVEDRIYENSQQVEMVFNIAYEVGSHADDTTTKMTEYLNAMRKNFGDGGRTLKGSVTDTSSKWLGDSVVVTMDPHETSFIDPSEETNDPSLIRVDTILRVRVWQDLS